MSEAVVKRLTGAFGGRVLESESFRGDEVVTVGPKDWVEVAKFLRDDDETSMAQLVDLTAVDHPEREPDGPRFDVLLMLRSMKTGARIRLRTRVADGQKLASLCAVWPGVNWAEREVYDMFGIPFDGHPDLRRILMYEEFEGHPLRKDYPIERAQPLLPYREIEGIDKLEPFGVEEGQPFARYQWEERLAGGDRQVSPAIAYQQRQRRALSDSQAAELLKRRLEARAAAKRAAEAASGEEAKPDESKGK
ncbi:MAG: NADH-quinone oxidoreductase subunit C [Myxococcales bacterium]|nr:NADH-quinone oxidoreductase subunit C [Myxococcales bacterium]